MIKIGVIPCVTIPQADRWWVFECGASFLAPMVWTSFFTLLTRYSTYVACGTITDGVTPILIIEDLLPFILLSVKSFTRKSQSANPLLHIKVWDCPACITNGTCTQKVIFLREPGFCTPKIHVQSMYMDQGADTSVLKSELHFLTRPLVPCTHITHEFCVHKIPQNLGPWVKRS